MKAAGRVAQSLYLVEGVVMNKVCKGEVRKRYHRRAGAIVWTALSLPFICGMAALAIDIGYVHTVRNELQTAADSAALAGASALASAEAVFGNNSVEPEYAAIARAWQFAAKNKIGGKAAGLGFGDVEVGRVNTPNGLNTQFLNGVQPYNAVRVIVRKENNSPNGPINLFFGPFLGKSQSESFAESVAFFDQRVARFKPKSGSGPMMPVSVRLEKWTDEITNGNGDDNYGFDPETGEVTYGPDGIPEISIYPEKQKNNNKGGGNNNSDGAGNFGLLNFNNGNNGVPTLARQVRDGLTADEIASVFGEDGISYHDDQGNPTDQIIDGNPGLKASLDDDFSSRIGDVVGFFIHTECDGSGSNALFTTVGMQFGRMLMVNLHGSMSSKAVVIQPAVYVGSEIITDPAAPVHATSGRIKLVR